MELQELTSLPSPFSTDLRPALPCSSATPLASPCCPIDICPHGEAPAASVATSAPAGIDLVPTPSTPSPAPGAPASAYVVAPQWAVELVAASPGATVVADGGSSAGIAARLAESAGSSFTAPLHLPHPDTSVVVPAATTEMAQPRPGAAAVSSAVPSLVSAPSIAGFLITPAACLLPGPDAGAASALDTPPFSYPPP